MNAWTTVQPLQLIIISTIYYLSSIVLLSFSYHLCVIDCLPVCSNESDQRSFILKLFLGCVRIFYVGRIQNGHTDLLPPQVCGRVWQGCRLGVQNCLLRLIALLDIKSPPCYLFKPSFGGCWIVCIIFIGSAFIDNKTCPRVC